MAQDPELERLAKSQKLGFQRRQETYDAMQSAWERRSSARDAMNRAFENRQRAYEELDRTWQRYQNNRDANGPRIDSLNAQQETAYQNMVRSFESASAAHERRDGASAKSYASEGHRYKAEAQQCVAERRRLVEEIRAAWPAHETAKAAFERAKEAFQSAKQSYDRAKAEHERAQAEFKQRKAEAEKAKDAFHKRLEQLKAQNKQRRSALARELQQRKATFEMTQDVAESNIELLETLLVKLRTPDSISADPANAAQVMAESAVMNATILGAVVGGRLWNHFRRHMRLEKFRPYGVPDTKWLAWIRQRLHAKSGVSPRSAETLSAGSRAGAAPQDNDILDQLQRLIEGAE